MDSCTNKELGSWLPFYELDALRPEDQLRFEEHLLECPYCCNELAAAPGSTQLLRKSRPQLQLHFQQQGIGFDAELGRYRDEHFCLQRLVRAGGLRSKLRGWTTWKGNYWPLIPALFAAAALMLFFIRPRETLYLSNSIVNLLPSQAIPYNASIVRGGSAADSALESIMGIYKSENYGDALVSLKRQVEMYRDHPQGWIYLGSTQYVLRNFDAASVAFEAAERAATGGALDANVTLYYGASLLQIGKNDSARVVLQKLKKQPNKAVARQAEAILQELGPP